MAAGGSGGGGVREIPEAIAAAKNKDEFKAALRDTRMHVTHRVEDVRTRYWGSRTAHRTGSRGRRGGGSSHSLPHPHPHYYARCRR